MKSLVEVSSWLNWWIVVMRYLFGSTEQEDAAYLYQILVAGTCNPCGNLCHDADQLHS